MDDVDTTNSLPIPDVGESGRGYFEGRQLIDSRVIGLGVWINGESDCDYDCN